MKKILAAALIFSASQAHAKGWWAEMCENLLGKNKVETTAEMQKVVDSLNEQIRVANGFTKYPVAANIERLTFLADNPTGIILKPKSRPEVQWLIQPELELFVNPNFLNVEWHDTKTGLSQAPALLMLVENVKTKSNSGQEVLVTGVLEEKVDHFRERNPGMEFQLRWKPAAEFEGLKFSGNIENKIVVWVEGKVENFQAKRILIVGLETVFEHLVQDPNYARITKTKSQ